MYQVSNNSSSISFHDLPHHELSSSCLVEATVQTLTIRRTAQQVFTGQLARQFMEIAQ